MQRRTNTAVQSKRQSFAKATIEEDFQKIDQKSRNYPGNKTAEIYLNQKDASRWVTVH